MSYLSSINRFLKKKSNTITISKPIDLIKERLLKLEAKLLILIELAEDSGYDFDEFEEKIFKLEKEVGECTEEASQTDLFWMIEDLIEGVSKLKKETNFFEKEDMLDLMSPNIDDNDFDEESISNDMYL